MAASGFRTDAKNKLRRKHMSRRLRLAPITCLVAASLLLSAAVYANDNNRSRSAAVQREHVPAPLSAAVTAPESATKSTSAVTAIMTQGFDVVSSGSSGCVTGWTCINSSQPLGPTSWFQGTPVTAGGPFDAQAGAANAYIGANFNNTGNTGTISNWLITPQVNFGTGATLSFWTRSSDVAAQNFSDRLEIRVSTGGTSVGSDATSVGDFTTLLYTVNPNLNATAGVCPPGTGGYPRAWCKITLSNANGIPNFGSGRIAFRYFVTNAGINGTNSDYIGIDTFSFDEGLPPTPPVLAYSPPAASTVTFPGVNTVGLSTGTLMVTPSGGLGDGGNGISTVNGCAVTGAAAANFAGAAAVNLSFVGTTTTPQAISLTCTAGVAVRAATLSCNETRGSGPVTQRQWPLACPVACSLDINADGALTANYDGVLLSRYLLGFRGSPLVQNVPLGASRPDAAAVASFIGSGTQYDVFGRPVPAVSAMQDGIVLLRLMLGVPDSGLFGGVALPVGAARTTPGAVRTFLNNRCATSF